MKKSDFFFELPQSLIAQTPIERRDSSRLLTMNRENGKLWHKHFTDLPDLIREGDCLVLNDSRVIPARLMGVIAEKSAPAEVVLLKNLDENVWECLVRPGKKIKKGTNLSFGDGRLTGEVIDISEGGNRLIAFSHDGIFLEVLNELGVMPLPPYIKEKLNDPERYQTVYSKVPGSAAAPTAGLHFTRELLDNIKNKGAYISYITLHVGLGTFRPVKNEDIEDHVMHSEYYIISSESAGIINGCREKGGRIIAVGTTACRTLESSSDDCGVIKPGSSWTDIFIYPGYKFKATDALLTNFHLPESTLIMLVSAFAGREAVLNAYNEAINEKYRFFSFGDAMFIY